MGKIKTNIFHVKDKNRFRQKYTVNLANTKAIFGIEARTWVAERQTERATAWVSNLNKRAKRGDCPQQPKPSFKSKMIDK